MDQKKILAKCGVDCILLFRGEYENYNYAYMSKNSCYGIFMLTRSGSRLIVPKMEAGRAKGIKKVIAKKSMMDELKKQLEAGSIKTVGVDMDQLRVNGFKGLKKELKGKNFKDVSKQIYLLRQKKTKEEIKTISEACRITEEIIRLALKKMKDFRQEGDVKAFLTAETIRRGCELAFPPVVASGPNGSVPHHDGNSKIRKGFLIIDFGVKYKGYCADITRTAYIGKPTKKEVDEYKKVQDVQKRCALMSKKGVRTHKIDDHARNALGNAFIHSVGHGIGVEVHESPSIFKRSKDIFEEGMCFTIEPGVYYPGKYGIRIEDNFVIKKGKAVKLSSMGNDLVSIPKKTLRRKY